MQGSFSVSTQPMRVDITMQRRLSLAGRIYKMILEMILQEHYLPLTSVAYIYKYILVTNGGGKGLVPSQHPGIT